MKIFVFFFSLHLFKEIFSVKPGDFREETIFENTFHFFSSKWPSTNPVTRYMGGGGHFDFVTQCYTLFSEVLHFLVTLLFFGLLHSAFF